MNNINYSVKYQNGSYMVLKSVKTHDEVITEQMSAWENKEDAIYEKNCLEKKNS